MGKPIGNEVVLRSRAKEVRRLILEEEEIEKAIEIIKQNEEILAFNFGRSQYLSLLPTIKYQKGLKNKYYYLRKVVETAVEIYIKNKNYEELVFFAAASCDIESFREAIKLIPERNHNKTREGDTVLLFFVKYADLENPRYLDTIEVLVNDYKISVNHSDYRDHTPIVILLKKYDSLQRKSIFAYNKKILNAVSIILNRSNVDITSVSDIIELYNLRDTLKSLQNENKVNIRIKSEIEDDTSILFSLLAQKNEQDFLEAIKTVENKEYLDMDDGNNTMLQLSCENNLKGVVVYLIHKGASLDKTTKRNSKTPLEIAARRNHIDIFRELLKVEKLTINLELFKVFLLNRGRQIKTKYFDEILCYSGLQLDIVYSNGNTPLHYAIIFSQREATLKLLKRGASLLVTNDMGKAPLDYIDKEDLELYFDHCILLDNHNKIHNKKYEIRLDFNGLFQNNSSTGSVDSEVEIASRICSSERLKSLATHPLVMSFLEVKWSMVSSLFNNILKVYAFFFLYYSFIVLFIGHITFLFLLTLSLLAYVTLQTSINLKNTWSYFKILFYVTFTILTYYVVSNSNISVFIIAVGLLYKFLQQHVYFSKYQALVINILRKVSLHGIILFGIYSLSDIENTLNCSKIAFPIIIYTLIITYSFNVLVDSVGDIENSFKTSYNIKTLNFVKFAENAYSKFDTVLKNPFLRDSFKTASIKITRKKYDRTYLHYFLNKNKFADEKLHFLKLEARTVKKLQDFVVKVSSRSNQKYRKL